MIQKKNKSKAYIIVPLILIAIAIAIFYGCFFALAPWLADSIPPEGWGGHLQGSLFISL